MLQDLIAVLLQPSSWYNHPSLFAEISFQDDRRKRKSPKNIVLAFFRVVIMFAETLWWGDAAVSPFNVLNIVRYGPRTRSSYRKMLILLPIEGAEWRIFIFGATWWICEPAQYAPEKKHGMAVYDSVSEVPELAARVENNK
jgi:hypothetical protein